MEASTVYIASAMLAQATVLFPKKRNERKKEKRYIVYVSENVQLEIFCNGAGKMAEQLRSLVSTEDPVPSTHTTAHSVISVQKIQLGMLYTCIHAGKNSNT